MAKRANGQACACVGQKQLENVTNGQLRVQDINSIPSANPTNTRFGIQSSTYREIVFVSSEHHIWFHGTERDKIVITYPRNQSFRTKFASHIAPQAG